MTPAASDDLPGSPLAVVCPDKFRGSLTAGEAAAAMAAGLEAAGWESVRSVPLADGGEGTLDALVAAGGGTLRRVSVTGPLGAPVDAEYAVLADGTAVVEMARASGLALAPENDPLGATTSGTGEMIAAAARNGAKRIVVGVGGSATTDGGLGAVEALRWSLRGLDVTVACDVTTPFLDAARVYGPQKGATPAQVELLTRRLARVAGDYQERTGVDVTALPGAGAAGGLAGGLAALGAQLAPGFDVVARAAGLEAALEGAALVLTGEGHLDAASFEGKVVGGVLRWTAAGSGAPVGVVAGRAEAAAADSLPAGTHLRTLVEGAGSDDEAMTRAAELVEAAARQIGAAVISEADPDRR